VFSCGHGVAGHHPELGFLLQQTRNHYRELTLDRTTVEGVVGKLFGWGVTTNIMPPAPM
jgi:hypothetical protein